MVWPMMTVTATNFEGFTRQQFCKNHISVWILGENELPTCTVKPSKFIAVTIIIGHTHHLSHSCGHTPILIDFLFLKRITLIDFLFLKGSLLQIKAEQELTLVDGIHNTYYISQSGICEIFHEQAAIFSLAALTSVINCLSYA